MGTPEPGRGRVNQWLMLTWKVCEVQEANGELGAGIGWSNTIHLSPCSLPLSRGQDTEPESSRAWIQVCALPPEDTLIAISPTPTSKLSEEIVHLLQQRNLVSNGS